MRVHLVGESAGIFQLDIPDHPDRLGIRLEPVKQDPGHVHPVASHLEEQHQLLAERGRPVGFETLVTRRPLLAVSLPYLQGATTSDDPLRRQGRVFVAEVRMPVAGRQLLWKIATCKYQCSDSPVGSTGEKSDAYDCLDYCN